MKHFLSCDWGTTSFRIRLAHTNDGSIIAEEKSAQGIAATFDLWQKIGHSNSDKRITFYLNIVSPYIKILEEKINQSLAGLPLIISGMASSSIGIVDIPYANTPIGLDGKGIYTHLIPASDHFRHEVLIISGVRAEDDIMRGEETQLIGCVDDETTIQNELYIFPGTHSKHILVKNNQIVAVKTYMTGEVFELLSQKSILKNNIAIAETSGDLVSFKKGVKDAADGDLLSKIFNVRTNSLFNIYSKEDNFGYLSGLLIGAELRDLKTTEANTINLICGTGLHVYYEAAITELALSETINTFPAQRVDEAAVRGQLKIGRQLKVII